MNVITPTKSVFKCISWVKINVLFNLLFVYVGRGVIVLFQHVYNCMLTIRKHYIQGLGLFSSKNGYLSDIKLIKKEVELFKKVPAHIVLIIGLESPSYEDLFKIIVWCVPAGVSHISFYDYKNSIDPHILHEIVSSKGNNYIPNISWGKSFNNGVNKFKTLNNGCPSDPVLQVHIYREEDGLENMVETVKNIHKKNIANLKEKDLEPIMRDNLGAPDPDLVIACGPLSYCGFSPWHLKISSLLSITSHHNISASTFLLLLHHYNKSEQRYGV